MYKLPLNATEKAKNIRQYQLLVDKPVGDLLKTSGDKAESVDKSKPAEKPVSLHPLKFKEAVKGMVDGVLLLIWGKMLFTNIRVLKIALSWLHRL